MTILSCWRFCFIFFFAPKFDSNVASSRLSTGVDFRYVRVELSVQLRFETWSPLSEDDFRLDSKPSTSCQLLSMFKPHWPSLNHFWMRKHGTRCGRENKKRNFSRAKRFFTHEFYFHFKSTLWQFFLNFYFVSLCNFRFIFTATIWALFTSICQPTFCQRSWVELDQRSIQVSGPSRWFIQRWKRPSSRR